MSPPKSSPRNPDNAGVLSPSVGQEPGLRHWPGRWWPSSYWGAEPKILSPSGDPLPKSTGKHRYFSTDLAGAVSKGQIEHCTQVPPHAHLSPFPRSVVSPSPSLSVPTDHDRGLPHCPQPGWLTSPTPQVSPWGLHPPPSISALPRLFHMPTKVPWALFSR